MMEEEEFCLNLGYNGQLEEFNTALEDAEGDIEEAFVLWTNLLYTRFKYLSAVSSLLFACNPKEASSDVRDGLVFIKVPKFIKERLERI